MDKPIADNRSRPGVKNIVSRGDQNLRPLLEAHIFGKMNAPTMNVLNISYRGEKQWKQRHKSLPSRLRIVDGDW
jgi:hypothetical protein